MDSRHGLARWPHCAPLLSMVRIGALAIFAALLHAQGTPPKETPAAYPVRATLGEYTLAAEYMVHSIPAASGIVVTNDYLVIEVAFFGPKYSHLKLSSD